MKSWTFGLLLLLTSTSTFSAAHRKNLKVLIDFLYPTLKNVSIKKIEWRYPERYVIDAEFIKGSRQRGYGVIPPQPCQILVIGQYNSRKKTMDYKIKNNSCR
ncbi:MAG: hypothetical protein DRQ88_02200 [Epsilonproteobacteria bacterium]|nr:MAG: hypothetical protein DRQ89_00945 [Campylobacterota bacterium]RLA67674.1 MAG: hypothetical protein DRQ88_02200 [Campylobacterota bacterium]